MKVPASVTSAIDAIHKLDLPTRAYEDALRRQEAEHGKVKCPACWENGKSYWK